MATRKTANPTAGQAATETLPAVPLQGDEPAAAKPPADRYLVRALPASGFRRAGRWWPSGAGIEVAASALTEEQIAQLLAEPMLAVVAIAPAET
ncbi:MAG: HI1506-related protein [Desulfobulbus sp.]|nr:HI1506-related protein [Desulfobulbus sp.]